MGDIFTEENIILKRVKDGKGFPPSYLDYLVKRPAPKNYKQGEPIEL